MVPAGSSMSAYDSYLYRAKHKPVQSHRLSICQPGRSADLTPDSQNHEVTSGISCKACTLKPDSDLGAQLRSCLPCPVGDSGHARLLLTGSW